MEQFDTCRTSRDEDWWGVGFWWLGDSHHTTSPATTDWAMPDWPVFCITGTVASQTPKTWDKWVMTCAFRSSPLHTHTHNSWLSEQNLLQHSLPHCHFGGRFQTLRLIQKNLRHIQQLTKLHARALNNLIWLHNFYSFLHNFFLVSLWPPPNCAHISIRITPRLRGWGFNLGLERERERAKDLLINGQDWTFTTRHCVCLFFFLKIQQKVK